MLAFTVKDNEWFHVGEVRICKRGDRIIIDAPKEIKIYRDKVYQRIKNAQKSSDGQKAPSEKLHSPDDAAGDGKAGPNSIANWRRSKAN